MATDKGHPSRVNKEESKTGVPSATSANKAQQNNEAEKHTNDDDEIADNVRQNHPNRNTDKDDATNIGGYRG